LLGGACPAVEWILFARPSLMLDYMGQGDYVGGMTENPDETRTVSEEPGRAETDRGETDLSTKLDPDFIPQQGETPEAKRAREHPEETGS
jgi:hypothetical protein